MTLAELFLPEFDQEIAKTRTMLERVPEDRFDYAPHAKSMKLGRLASHLAEMPQWLSVTVTTEGLEPTPEMKGFNASSRQQLLDELDTRTIAAREHLAKATDEDLAITWTFKWQGQGDLRAAPSCGDSEHGAEPHDPSPSAVGCLPAPARYPDSRCYGPSADEMAAMAST